MAMTREEFAFTLKQKYPQYRDLDNNQLVDRVVSKYPQYRSAIVDLDGAPEPAKAPEAPRTMGDRAADFGKGFLGGAARTVTNLGELGTRLGQAFTSEVDTTDPTHGIGTMVSRFMGDSAEGQAALQPFQEAKEEVEEFIPDTTSAKVGELGEAVGEFALGGAAKTGLQAGAKTALSPLAQKVLHEAITGGTVGSLREGKLFDPKAAVSSGIGGGVAHGLGALGSKLSKRAIDTYAKVVGTAGGSQGRGKVLQAIERMLGEGNLPKGDITAQAAQARKAADEAHQALNTFRQSAPKSADLDTVIQSIQGTLKTAGSSGKAVNPADAARLDEIVERLEGLRGTPADLGGGKVEITALDDILTDLSQSFAKASEPATASAQATTRRAGNALREQLNLAQPGRRELGQRISQQEQLAKRLGQAAEKKPFQPAGSAGAILALTGIGAGTGAALGGKEGAAVGALAGAAGPFAFLKLVRSPTWRSLSARSQEQMASALQKMPREQMTRAINAIILSGGSEKSEE